jgi:hypothetical protein
LQRSAQQQRQIGETFPGSIMTFRAVVSKALRIKSVSRL